MDGRIDGPTQNDERTDGGGWTGRKEIWTGGMDSGEGKTDAGARKFLKNFDDFFQAGRMVIRSAVVKK